VQQDDWDSALRSGHLVGDLERRRAHPYKDLQEGSCDKT
jgi:hypothetical protein